MLNTRLLMTASAFLMGAAGILLSFLPQEAGALLGWTSTEPIVLQLLGALYFAFAMINWTAKASMLGGIYGRPITIGNFTHFVIAALALVKASFKSPEVSIIIIASLYVLFTLLFGYVFFTHPLKKSSAN